MKPFVHLTILLILPLIISCNTQKVKLVGGSNFKFFVTCSPNSLCYGATDPSLSTIFELTNENNNYFMLMIDSKYCLRAVHVSYGKWHLRLDSSCQPNDNNLWKNDLGQVYNKQGRALWWLKDNYPVGVTSAIGCFISNGLPTSSECLWRFQKV